MRSLCCWRRFFCLQITLNSAFSTIGKATADKITAKHVGKTHAFAFAWLSVHLNTRSCSESRLWNFEHFLCFWIGFLSHLEWKCIVIELPDTFLSFGCLHLRVLVDAGLDFCTFNLRWPPWFVCLVHSLPSNIFCWVGTPGDRAKLVLNLNS